MLSLLLGWAVCGKYSSTVGDLRLVKYTMLYGYATKTFPLSALTVVYLFVLKLPNYDIDNCKGTNDRITALCAFLLSGISSYKLILLWDEGWKLLKATG